MASVNPLDVDPVPDQQQLERKQQIDNFCRLCLCEPLKLISLRSIIGDVSVPDMFAALTGVQIDFDDPYPKRVCAVCLEKLEKAYEIRKEFLDSVATLESYFQSEEVVVKEEDFEVVVKEEVEDEEVDVEPATTSKMGMLGESSESECSPDYAGAGESQEMRTMIIQGTKRRRPKRRLKIVGEPSIMDPLLCYVCKTKFNDGRELNIHLPKHADMLPYTCEPCGSFQEKKIITVVMLHRHFQMHAGTIECPHCPIRVYNEDRLYAHIKRYHAKHSRAKFTCEKCGYQLNSKESYQSHMVRHDAVEEGRYTCLICNKKFGNSSRLKRHELTHQETKEYQCQYCSKSISSKTLLLTHEREHVDAGDLKQYACAFCDERFSTRSAQTQHVSTEHPESVERRSTARPNTLTWKAVGSQRLREDMKCPFEGCSFIANCYQSFYNHKNRHQNRFECPHCQKCFANRQQLNIHKNTHLDKTERPFACDQCDKRFASQARLTDHVRLHTGSKPYLCTECGESFFTSQRLAHHVLKHAPPQHKCKICGKEFRYKGDHVRHVRKHEDDVLAKEEILDPVL